MANCTLLGEPVSILTKRPHGHYSGPWGGRGRDEGRRQQPRTVGATMSWPRTKITRAKRGGCEEGVEGHGLHFWDSGRLAARLHPGASGPGWGLSPQSPHEVKAWCRGWRGWP